MSNTAIKVERLSKRYRIGLKEEKHETLAGALASWITSPIDNLRRLRELTKFDDMGESTHNQQTSATINGELITDNTSHSDVIWALKDVSFEVKKGEVIGIIGRNGADRRVIFVYV